jgi:hypothetical protein
MTAERTTGSWVRSTIGVVFTRDFWTFKAVNALFGVLLTIGSGLAQIGIGDTLRSRMDDLDAVEQEADARIRRIDAAVFEFKLFETDATLVQVLTLTEAIIPAVRDQMRAIAIGNRRHAFLVILTELHPDTDGFVAARTEYDRLVDGAVAWDNEMANALVEMESTKIQAAHQLQQALVNEMFDARSTRLMLSNRLDRYTTIGTTVQMIGLLAVLIGNLLADHMSNRRGRVIGGGEAPAA